MVTVRYFAGAREAAGTGKEPVLIAAGTTLAQLREELVDLHGAAMGRILPACSFLIDETGRDQGSRLSPGTTVDVLPPFAGG